MSFVLTGHGSPRLSGLETLRSRRLALLGPRLFDFLPLLREVDPEVVMVCESGPDAEGMASGAGARLLSPEATSGRRAQRLNSDIDEMVPLACELSARAPRAVAGKRITVLAYGATTCWERAAAASGGRIHLVAPAAALKLRLDDKIETRRQFGRLGIPTPQHGRIPAGEIDFAALAHRFGCPFVLQEPVGASGVGTFVVHGPNDLEPVRRRSTKVPWWLASTYLLGPVVNIHGFVGEEGVSVAPPSVQLSGIPELSVTPASYNGNDFGAAMELPPAVLESVNRSTAETGRWLATLGYRGAFGVDFIAGDSEAHALEVNPRLQGSTWLLGEMERAAGRTPLLIRHFLELLGEAAPLPPAREAAPVAQGGYLTLRWCGSSPVTIDGHPRPGVHVVGPDNLLEYRRPALGLLECSQGEFVITGLPPTRGTLVDPGAPLARVAAWCRLGGPDGHSLSDDGRRITTAVLGAFGGLPPDRGVRKMPSLAP